jgi:hypothetical protein
VRRRVACSVGDSANDVGGKVFTRPGRATDDPPLFIVLVAIGSTDLLFALDSIPASLCWDFAPLFSHHDHVRLDAVEQSATTLPTSIDHSLHRRHDRLAVLRNRRRVLRLPDDEQRRRRSATDPRRVLLALHPGVRDADDVATRDIGGPRPDGDGDGAARPGGSGTRGRCARIGTDHLHRPAARERGTPRRYLAIAPSPSQTSAGHRPSRQISCHQPANKSCAARAGISTRQHAGQAAPGWSQG